LVLIIFILIVSMKDADILIRIDFPSSDSPVLIAVIKAGVRCEPYLSLGPRSGGRHRARRAPQQMGLTVSITASVSKTELSITVIQHPPIRE
jgi:hypothetical protein